MSQKQERSRTEVIPQYAPTPQPYIRPQPLGTPRQPAPQVFTPTYEIPLPETISRTVIAAGQGGKSLPLLGDGTASILCRAVLVIAFKGNLADINVTMKAGGAGNGITLGAGSGLRIPTPDAGNVYFSGSVGDAIEYLIEVAP